MLKRRHPFSSKLLNSPQATIIHHTRCILLAYAKLQFVHVILRKRYIGVSDSTTFDIRNINHSSCPAILVRIDKEKQKKHMRHTKQINSHSVSDYLKMPYNIFGSCRPLDISYKIQCFKYQYPSIGSIRRFRK